MWTVSGNLESRIYGRPLKFHYSGVLGEMGKRKRNDGVNRRFWFFFFFLRKQIDYIRWAIVVW